MFFARNGKESDDTQDLTVPSIHPYEQNAPQPDDRSGPVGPAAKLLRFLLPEAVADRLSQFTVQERIQNCSYDYPRWVVDGNNSKTVPDPNWKLVERSCYYESVRYYSYQDSSERRYGKGDKKCPQVWSNTSNGDTVWFAPPERESFKWTYELAKQTCKDLQEYHNYPGYEFDLPTKTEIEAAIRAGGDDVFQPRDGLETWTSSDAETGNGAKATYKVIYKKDYNDTTPTRVEFGSAPSGTGEKGMDNPQNRRSVQCVARKVK
jgi:hypothetical protein